jgi:hypothetical protein
MLPNTWRMKNTPTYVCAKNVFDLQEKVRKLILYLTYCSSIIILENAFK